MAVILPSFITMLAPSNTPCSEDVCKVALMIANDLALTAPDASSPAATRESENERDNFFILGAPYC